MLSLRLVIHMGLGTNRHVVVGGFSSAGLYVYYNFFVSYRYGVACCRKFCYANPTTWPIWAI